MEDADKTRKTITVYVFLGVISVFYNRWIDGRPDRFMEKWTWATVVGGVLYTLGGVWLLDRRAAKLTFAAFCWSGAAMALGDIRRYVVRCRNGYRHVQEVLQHARGERTSGVAGHSGR